MTGMPLPSFDDPALRSAMATYLDVAGRLDAVASVGGQPRELVDLAESKAMAGIALRKRLTDAGWTAPVGHRVTL